MFSCHYLIGYCITNEMDFSCINISSQIKIHHVLLRKNFEIFFRMFNSVQGSPLHKCENLANHNHMRLTQGITASGDSPLKLTYDFFNSVPKIMHMMQLNNGRYSANH